MKLQSTSIKGVLRFEDPLTIDFSTLPEGLIAFVGPNGQGKTTALETPLAALFRSFPSRDKKELCDYAHDRDSYVETVFAFDNGDTFRARVNVDGVRRLSEAVLVHAGPDGSVLETSDGKVSTFDALVATSFPAREVLLASTFSAQDGSGSLLRAERKERKQVFSKLLGLGRYEQMAETARKAAALVETERGKVLAVRDALARECGPDKDAALLLAERSNEVDRRNVEEEQIGLRARITDTEASLATVADQAAAYAVATQRVQIATREDLSARTEHARLHRERSTVDEQLEAERGRLARRLAATRNDLEAARAKAQLARADEGERADRELVAALKDIDERIANNRGVMAKADAIRAAVAKVAEIETLLSVAREDERTWRDVLAKRRTYQADLLERIAVASRGRTALDRAVSDAELLKAVPCGGVETFAGCRFLANAKAAEQQIPALREVADRLEALDRERIDVAADIASAQQQIDRIATLCVDLARDQKAAAATAKLEASLAAAEARIAELEAKRTASTAACDQAKAAAAARMTERFADLSTQSEAALSTHDADLAALLTRTDSRRQELDTAIDAIGATLLEASQRLQEARAALADAEAGNQQAAQLQARLADLRSQWDRTTRELARLEAQAADIARQRKALADRRAELSTLDARLSTLATELVEWQVLSQALGRDGLPVLEIDAAGPTVSAYANDLLSSCFGPRFSLELVTQEAKASGKGMKEAFAIQVLDNERGGAARDIGDLSGGEQIIVAEALANAIALAANARNEHPIRTCWRDETTGPLDSENAARYVPMLRKLRELGGFHHVIFVSHNPESAAMADAQVRFADGQATVALPPYAA